MHTGCTVVKLCGRGNPQWLCLRLRNDCLASFWLRHPFACPNLMQVPSGAGCISRRGFVLDPKASLGLSALHTRGTCGPSNCKWDIWDRSQSITPVPKAKKNQWSLLKSYRSRGNLGKSCLSLRGPGNLRGQGPGTEAYEKEKEKTLINTRGLVSWRMGELKGDPRMRNWRLESEVRSDRDRGRVRELSDQKE
jgi:hypothetical protein